MNRPRNRQPRPDRQSQDQHSQNNAGGRGGRGGGGRGGRGPPKTSSVYGAVPTIQQVVPGAGVFIVLKEDQPTGNETHGQVQDVLTRGNHPRGIKVRLRDGQVGRVLRMDGLPVRVDSPPAREGHIGSAINTPRTGFSQRYTDVRYDEEYPAEPPARSLADFMPDLLDTREVDPGSAESGGDAVFSQANIKCPFCESFRGDEAAVTHHIDREHLS